MTFISLSDTVGPNFERAVYLDEPDFLLCHVTTEKVGKHSWINGRYVESLGCYSQTIGHFETSSRCSLMNVLTMVCVVCFYFILLTLISFCFLITRLN